MRQVRQHTPQLIELASVVIADPVACDGYKVRRLLPRALEGVDDVAVVNHRTDMRVCNVGDGASFKLRRKPAHTQPGIGELKPVRLPPPGVEPGHGSSSPGDKKSFERAAAGKHDCVIKDVGETRLLMR